MRVWRLCRKRHLATAFSGEGARLESARWNHAGTSMAYASEHLSLAALEVFVHVEAEEEPRDLVSICAEVPMDDLLLRAQQDSLVQKLSATWRYHAEESQQIGSEWARSRASVAMLVPSVVIEEEWNVLINPEHPDAKQIKIVQTKPFRFDERMFKSHS